MFTPQQYRAKAAKYAELVETAASAEEKREFKELQDSFLALAANTQWMADNQDKTVHPAAAGGEPPQFVSLNEAEIIRSDAVQDKAAIATWTDEGGAPLAPSQQQQSQQQQGQQQQAQQRGQSPAVHEAGNEKAVT